MNRPRRFSSQYSLDIGYDTTYMLEGSTPEALLLEVILLLLVGLAAGALGGLLGVGGSIVMIPCLTELRGEHQHLYQAAAMIVTFFVALPALRQHLRAGAVTPGVLKSLVPAAGVGAVAGVACSEVSAFRGDGSVLLGGVFGLFLFCVAAREFHGLLQRPTEPESPSEAGARGARVAKAAWLVGFPTGVVSGLLGVGGGVVAVPLQQRFLRLPLRTAIGNSTALIAAISLVGAAAKHVGLALHHPEYVWYEPSRLALLLIPTAVVGATAGAKLTHVLPLRVVRAAFIVFVLAAAVRMCSRAAAARYDSPRGSLHAPATAAAESALFTLC